MSVDMRQNDKVTVYIPTGLPRSDEVIRWVETRLSEELGGATEVTKEANGSWINPETGELVHDTVSMVHSFGSDIPSELVEEIGRYVKDTLNEDAVLIEKSTANVAFV